MQIFIILMIAVSLSMDAFSLSLAYGTLGITKKEISKLSFIVGLYHFFMPILGMKFGNYITSFIHLGTEMTIFIIFSLRVK